MSDRDFSIRRSPLFGRTTFRIAFVVTGVLLYCEAPRAIGVFAGSGKSIDVTVAVVGSDGKTVTDAKVVLLELGGSAEIDNGELIQPPVSQQKRPDPGGHWHFTTDADEFWIVAVHPSGWAHVKGTRTSAPKTLSLSPWARAEGTYAVARQPCADVDLEIEGHTNLEIGKGVANLTTSNQQKTDAHGHFVFEHVLPGLRYIGSVRNRKPSEPREMMSTCRMTAHFFAGKTTRIDFGNAGRTVIGRLKAPEGGTQPRWRDARIDVHRDRRGGLGALSFLATVDDRGEFLIDDVPTGKYYLSVPLISGTLFLMGYAFEVPPISEKLTRRPVDLGMIMLKKLDRPAVPAKARR
jgi:hypothetical protein